MRGWLTRVNLGQFRAGAPISLSLDVEDVYAAGATVHGSVRPSMATGDLRATLEWVAGPGQPADPVIFPLAAADGPRAIETPPQPPGCYRITVSGSDDVEPV